VARHRHLRQIHRLCGAEESACAGVCWCVLVCVCVCVVGDGAIEGAFGVAVPAVQSVQAGLQVIHPHVELSIAELPQV
jgi:hypothetical protein